MSECPEGLALKWARTIEAADLAIGWGSLPGGLPLDGQDQRTAQAFETVRRLRDEQRLEDQAAALALVVLR